MTVQIWPAQGRGDSVPHSHLRTLIEGGSIDLAHVAAREESVELNFVPSCWSEVVTKSQTNFRRGQAAQRGARNACERSALPWSAAQTPSPWRGIT